jgi:hypothetical protein
MASVEVEEAVQEIETESERVLRWRVDELKRAGYDERLALKLALRRHVDLHRAVDLLRHGCDPALAARILV